MEFEPKKKKKEQEKKKKAGFPISTTWLYLCILYQWNFLYWRLKTNGNFCGLLLWAPSIMTDFQVWFLDGRKRVGFV